MTGEPVTTIVGNTTAPAEIRFTQAGVPVANFTVASTPRTFNRQTNQWEDGEALFMRCSVWRDQAENVAETLAEKGMRVVVTGLLEQHSFQDRDGNNRTSIQMKVDEVGTSLKYGVAQVRKVQRGQQGGGFQGQPQGGFQGQQQGGFSGQGAPQGGYAPQGGQQPQQGAWAGQQGQQQGQQSPWAGQQQGAPQGQQGGFSGPGPDDPPF